MEVYSLTSTGRDLAHSYKNPDKGKWGIIYFLAKRGKATKEQILSYVKEVNSYDLAELKAKHIIVDETQVNI